MERQFDKAREFGSNDCLFFSNLRHLGDKASRLDDTVGVAQAQLPASNTKIEGRHETEQLPRENLTQVM